MIKRVSPTMSDSADSPSEKKPSFMASFQRNSNTPRTTAFGITTRRSNVVDVLPEQSPAKAQSLGSGTFSAGAVLSFVASPRGANSVATTRTDTSVDQQQYMNKAHDGAFSSRRLKLRAMLSSENVMNNIEHLSEKISERLRPPTATFTRLRSSFIRVSDLQMTSASLHTEEANNYPNFHHASQDPPPGIDHDENEQWVALDDGEGSHAPIAPMAVQALAKFGYKTASDENMWHAEGKTDRLLRNTGWGHIAWQERGPIDLPEGFFDSPTTKDEVPVWTGNFIHGLYGSDLPAIRSCGIVNMSPKALTDLLVDSTRVKEYNKISLGRTDLLMLQDNLYASEEQDNNHCATIPEEQQDEQPFGCSITKVMKSVSRPPVVRSNVEFVSIMHATALDDGSGYLLVSRAVTQHSEGVVASLTSEILMGVNVIRSITGFEEKCLMINVNHIKTPMVPLFIGKRLGLAAAPGFIQDLRALC